MLDEDGKTRVLLEGILGATEPATQRASVVIQNVTTLVIGDHANLAHPPPPSTITEPQSRLLKHLVAQIGKAERLANPAHHDARTWTKLNATLGVEHHRDIPKKDFDRAKHYLEGWLRRLSQKT